MNSEVEEYLDLGDRACQILGTHTMKKQIAILQW